MRKITLLLNFLRAKAAELVEHEAVLEKINKARGARVEVPFFQIDGAEKIYIGENSSIGRNSWLSCYTSFREQSFEPEIRIGDNVRIGNYACLTAIGRIEIGNGCLFSDGVYISDHTHGIDPESNNPLVSEPIEFKGAVIVGNNCFVGMRACILPGVTLGEHSVIGASSVVTRSFPAYSMIAGAPARVIKTFSLEANEWVDVRPS